MAFYPIIYVDENKVKEKHFNPVETPPSGDTYNSMELYFGQSVEIPHEEVTISTEEYEFTEATSEKVWSYRLVKASTFGSYNAKNATKLISDFKKMYGKDGLQGRKLDQFGFLEEKKNGTFVLHGVDAEDLSTEVMTAFLNIKMPI